MRILDSKRTLSIDFGSSNIKLVEGKYSKKGISINKSFIVDLPEKVYSDGRILDIHRLGEVLRKALKENNISTERVNGIINSSEVVTREITVPKISPKEIESILSYQMEEYIPIKAEDYIVQPIVLDTIFEQTVEKLNLLLVGIPKEIIESHLYLFENLGLKANVLDFQGNAISKLINFTTGNGKQLSKETVASLDIGYENTKLTLIEEGHIKLTRILNLGIGHGLSTARKDLNIQEKVLLELLTNLSLSQNYSENSKEGQLQSILRENLSLIFEGVDMVFRYHSTRELGNKIDLILLQGGIVGLKDFETTVVDYFDIKALKLDSLDKLDFQDSIWRFSNAIGGLIRVGEV